MKDNKSRDIFYGVVAVATLIVALVGATLAYFSISKSSAEGAVNAKAAIVSVDYQDGQQISAQATELIPSEFKYVKAVYESLSEDSYDSSKHICIDDNEKQICSIYRFSVKTDNPAGNEVVATLNNEYNGFTDLSYAVRDVTNNTWLDLSADNSNIYTMKLGKCSNTDEESSNDCYVTQSDGTKKYSTTDPIAVRSIFGYKTVDANTVMASQNIKDTAHVYDIVLFLDETKFPQNYDQGQEYQGTIIVDVSGASGRITGYVEGVE